MWNKKAQTTCTVDAARAHGMNTRRWFTVALLLPFSVPMKWISLTVQGFIQDGEEPRKMAGKKNKGKTPIS